MLSNIETVLEAADLEIDGVFFLKIVKDTIEWRDKAKVEFTRTLSDTIELLAKAGDLLDFTRTQLVHLEIEQILSNDNTRRDVSEIRKSWYINIEENRRTKKLNDCVLLPSVIQSKNDFLIIQPGESKPNFVTCKTVEAPVVVLNEISSENIPNLGGRIVA
jgi:hypothetical protein